MWNCVLFSTLVFPSLSSIWIFHNSVCTTCTPFLKAGQWTKGRDSTIYFVHLPLFLTLFLVPFYYRAYGSRHPCVCFLLICRNLFLELELLNCQVKHIIKIKTDSSPLRSRHRFTLPRTMHGKAFCTTVTLALSMIPHFTSVHLMHTA